MTTFLIIYALGFFTTGIFLSLMMFKNSFNDYLYEKLEECKRELLDETPDKEDNDIIKNININKLINSYIFLLSICSWIGFIIAIFAVISWLIEK